MFRYPLEIKQLISCKTKRPMTKRNYNSLLDQLKIATNKEYSKLEETLRTISSQDSPGDQSVGTPGLPAVDTDSGEKEPAVNAHAAEPTTAILQSENVGDIQCVVSATPVPRAPAVMGKRLLRKRGLGSQETTTEDDESAPDRAVKQEQVTLR